MVMASTVWLPETAAAQRGAQPLAGSVVAWGYNRSGQATVPAGVLTGGAIAIGAAGIYSLALKEDATVVAWGGSRCRRVG